MTGDEQQVLEAPRPDETPKTWGEAIAAQLNPFAIAAARYARAPIAFVREMLGAELAELLARQQGNRPPGPPGFSVAHMLCSPGTPRTEPRFSEGQQSLVLIAARFIKPTATNSRSSPKGS